MRPIHFLPLSLFLGACQPNTEIVPPTNAIPTPPPELFPSASADAKPETPAPGPPEEKVFPLPPTPPGADPEKVAIAASICAAAVIQSQPDKALIGCRTNPPFDKPDRKPDGVLVADRDPTNVCTIDEMYRGSFTRPGAKQTLLAFGTCDDGGGWNGAMPGSVVVVEASPTSRWKVVTHELDLNAITCLMDRRADGRDILVCHDNWGAPPMGALRWFYSIDLSQEPRVRQFAKMYFGDWPIHCGPPYHPPEFLEYGVTSLSIKSFVLADANKDGKKDLVVKVQRARAPASKAMDAKIEALCKGGADSVKSTAYLPPAKEITLEFLSDGASFTPTPATRKLLDAWQTEAPESFWNLK